MQFRYSAGRPRGTPWPRISRKAWRMIRTADDRPRQAIMAATAMSGHAVADAHTPAPASITAMLAMQSLRVHSQTRQIALDGVASQRSPSGQ
jgi:hypothetical protein